MNAQKTAKDLFFKIRHGFRGVPFYIGEHTVRLDESLRRWDINMESSVHQVLSEHLKPGDIFIDVGANFGLHTLYAAKLVGSEGHVFSFEPVESNLTLLHRNVKFSGVETQVTVISKAVSASSAPFLEFYLPPEEVAVTAALKVSSGEFKKIQVANIRLDDFWKDIAKPVRAIKIDVEGAELEVLRGAQQILSQWHPILIIEVHGFALSEFDTNLSEFRNFLTDFDYQEYRLDGNQFTGDDYYQAVYQ